MTNEQIMKLEWVHNGMVSIHLLHYSFKSGR